MKRLINYRLYDRDYGDRGNPQTLSVSLRDDNTLQYSCYGGWQDSGVGFSISNMQLRKSLPTNIKTFSNSDDLHKEIESVLSTGVGSNKIKSFEILNNI